MPTYTPMIQQYLSIKEEYKDAFLFFRLGDFYEMFFDDAVRAAQLLEITLTSRDGGGDDRIPMCGVPHHSAKQYIKRFIELGFKVAICEQVEDPKEAKGVVKREVTHLISPGMVMDEQMLTNNDHNFLGAIASEGNTYSVALCDLTTGTLQATYVQTSLQKALEELQRADVREVVVSNQWQHEVSKINQWAVTLADEVDPKEYAQRFTLEHEENLPALALLVNYLEKTQRRTIDHLQAPYEFELEEFVQIDTNGRRTLELTETMREKTKKGSLLWLLDETKTAMGARKLKTWLEKPLRTKHRIDDRLQAVEKLLEHFTVRHDLRESFANVYDIERLAGRMSYGNANARDLVQIKKTITALPAIYEGAKQLNLPVAKDIHRHMQTLQKLHMQLSEALLEDVPMSITEGGMIAEGYSEELDRYRDAGKNGKAWIAELEQKEREATNIRSLKVGYNRVFGYYIEVSKANLKYLPEGRYERKQTLTNAERFITNELKEKEALILQAEEKSIDLEHELFIELRKSTQAYIPDLQQLASFISELDVLTGFAEVSEAAGFVRPVFTNDGELNIVEGRHPVVEKMTVHQQYVPNTIQLDKSTRMLLITGPNMSGKSTYMRQVALISIMAQIGCFVPATEARLPLFDQIFTRIGAADDLASGQSTFMVEMMEANDAIQQATEESLILLDEIGRGTSTYDGMALAQAIIEYIHEHIGAVTLFSTHYHELTRLSEQLSALENVHVQATEDQEEIVFLHKVMPGPSDKSYGIHVARLAGLPEELTRHATELLEALEEPHKEVAVSEHSTVVPVEKVKESEVEQLSLFPEPKVDQEKDNMKKSEKAILSDIKAVDLMDMTPLEAMNWLYNIKKRLKS
ncbi:DNA mismatch repair protein MutS [Bacillaceae bacterium SIJ1]|uniref:DNA mismatch repair protein MutS n=1 Tax=Litoribacterium kuwaitense TaxID=1398745 RepID=UPI0013EB3767|nr:DNA mismatch repair protein MutS [Litoribacterium kuwaitense]NGP44057.1 DNA mismatch repair protein MutS [Litoribacterium kuwaitense]